MNVLFFFSLLFAITHALPMDQAHPASGASPTQSRPASPILRAQDTTLSHGERAVLYHQEERMYAKSAKKAIVTSCAVALAGIGCGAGAAVHSLQHGNPGQAAGVATAGGLAAIAGIGAAVKAHTTIGREARMASKKYNYHKQKAQSEAHSLFAPKGGGAPPSQGRLRNSFGSVDNV